MPKNKDPDPVARSPRRQTLAAIDHKLLDLHSFLVRPNPRRAIDTRVSQFLECLQGSLIRFSRFFSSWIEVWDTRHYFVTLPFDELDITPVTSDALKTAIEALAALVRDARTAPEKDVYREFALARCTTYLNLRGHNVTWPSNLAERSNRVSIDDETNTVRIDDKEINNVDPNGLAVFRFYWEQKANGETRPIPARKLIGKLPGANHERTILRWIEKLPDEIRNLIKSQRGCGRWIELTPKKIAR